MQGRGISEGGERKDQGCPDLGAWDQPVSAQDAMLRCVPRVSPPH